MSDLSSPSARRVQEALRALDGDQRVIELKETARSAIEAAAAIGCPVERIAKSLVFRGRTSGKAILVIASGSRRVDEERVAEIVGERIRRASPEFVREATGFAIGGVPPLGHERPLETLVDETLMDLEAVWAAAGTPSAVFRITPAELVRLTRGRVAAVASR